MEKDFCHRNFWTHKNKNTMVQSEDSVVAVVWGLKHVAQASLYVAKDDLELLILPPPHSRCWDYGVPLLLVCGVLGIKPRTFFFFSIFKAKSHSDAKLARASGSLPVSASGTLELQV